MKRKYVGPLIFFLIFLLGLILVLIIIGVFFYLQVGGTPQSLLVQPPSIEIMHPRGDRVINSGDGLMLAAVAFSDVGLQRVDFLVDGLVGQQVFADPLGAQSSDAFFPWFGSTTGIHQLSVVAYDVQGRASAPASVQVGVQAVAGIGEMVDLAPEADIPLEDQPPPQGEGEALLEGEAEPQGDDQPQGDGDPQAPDQPADRPAEQPAEQPAPDQAQPDAPAEDLNMPPQPQDQPPQITRFDVFVDVFGGENGAPIVVTSAAVGSAQDDLGLERLTLTWRNDGGQQGDFSTLCAAALACEIEMEAVLDVGRWVFSLQAFDTSGQVSEPSLEIIEVIGEQGQPPAAAEHDDPADWLREHLRNQAEQFDFEADLGDFWRNQGMNMDEFLEEMFPGAGAAEPPVEAAQEEGFCLNMVVQPEEEGNRVSMEILCDLQAEGDGHFLLPSVSKSLLNTGDDGINLFIQEWNDENRVAIQVGETFSWLDWDVTCDTGYRYVLHVNNAIRTDIGLAIGETFAIASAEATTPNCTPGSIGDTNLWAELQPEGVQIRWDIAGGGDWPDDLPDEGVAFILTRFEELSGQVVELSRQNIPADLLIAGGDFSVLDENSQCDQHYWYSLAALPADRDLNLVSPGWLLRTTIQGPQIPCAADEIGALDLVVTPFWVQNAFQHIRMQVELPAGFNWPAGENVELKIARIQPGADHCEGPPCLGNWQVKNSVRITDEIRLNGFLIDDVDWSVHTGNHAYTYRLALIVDGEEVQVGSAVQVTTAPAPPPPPDILRLTATNDCPGGVRRCVLVEWDLYEQPRLGPIFYQAARIAVERIVQGFDQREFQVGLADTQFMDRDLFVMVLELANGEVRQICHHDVTYRMIAYSAEGYMYGASPLTLDMPAECDDPLNIVVERRR
jgi:hypothetical protein